MVLKKYPPHNNSNMYTVLFFIIHFPHIFNSDILKFFTKNVKFLIDRTVKMELNNNVVGKEVAGMVLQSSDAKAAAKLADEAKTKEVRGYDLNKGIDYEKILAGYMNTGFQATSFGMAVNEINRMVIDFRNLHILWLVINNNF